MVTVRLVRSICVAAVYLICVQGSIYLLQVASALRMTSEEYSHVRIIESLVAVLALVATFGVPSVVLVRSSIAPSERQRRHLLGSAIIIIGVLGLALACVAILARQIGWLQIGPGDHPYWVGVLGLLVSLRLLLVCFTQARQAFGRLAISAVVSCVATALAYVLLPDIGVGGAATWFASRCVLESGCCLLLLANEMRSWSGDGIVPAAATREVIRGPLISAAAPVGGALILRAVVEHGPVLWLDAVGASAVVIARVGLLITLGTMALMPSGVAQTVLIPAVARSLANSAAVRRLDRLAIFWITAFASGTAATFVVMMMLASRLVSWGDYLTFGILIGGVGIVLAKFAANALGAYLLAAERLSAILFVNLGTLIIGLGAALLVQRQQHLGGFDVGSLVWIICAVEAFGAVVYSVTVAKSRRPSRLSEVASPQT